MAQGGIRCEVMNAKPMLAVAIAVAIVATVLFTTVQPAGVEISCKAVAKLVVPCLEFLTGKIGSPSPFCCTGGVKNPKAMTLTTHERRAACECLKKAASDYPDLNPQASQALQQY
ncbi:hypothetical protein Q3G72_002168 [Acer saccharum]|nr:hypothetical protein Q3G72_002168 [Acer saccharum]